MATRSPVLTCAVTGSTLSPSMSPDLPVTAEAMINRSLEAASGAAILHFHAGDPADGRPSNDLAAWRGFLPEIRTAVTPSSTCPAPWAQRRKSASPSRWSGGRRSPRSSPAR
ncbi:3-keto-5-aminohexanoate cleavage protein [Teichococcus coralli]|uniref:3-keto-5-aminohexanoate cleavage protein n=1 Tax=Teichococcus coralli TaxID=2545983 RepID=UPI003461C417